MGGSGEVEDEEKERQSFRGKVLEERVRDVVRTGCGAGGRMRDSCGELAGPKRGAERSVVGRQTRRGTQEENTFPPGGGL